MPGLASAALGDLDYRDCITGDTAAGPGGSGACSAIPRASAGGIDSGLDDLTSVALSADGASLYAASEASDAVAHFDRDTATGALTYQGCITGDTDAGAGGSRACTAIPSATAGGADSGLEAAASLALSADGASLYAGAAGDDALARFNRDPGTGDLAYRDCITGNENGPGSGGTGACTDSSDATATGVGSGLNGVESLALSADGASLYVAASLDDAVARFDRSAASGALAYVDCITGGKSGAGSTGTAACVDSDGATATGFGSGLDFPASVALSADGASLYAAAFGDSSVAGFDRDTVSGALTYRACITGSTAAGPGGSGSCTAIASAAPAGAGSGLNAIQSVALGAGGTSLYTASASDDAVARFNRNPGTGDLAYRDCITGNRNGPGSGGTGACTDSSDATSSGAGSGLQGVESVALSADGSSLYAAAALDDAVVRLDRSAASGALTYRECVTGSLTGAGSAGTGACVDSDGATASGASSGLDQVDSLAPSADGASLYTASLFDSAVADFVLEDPPATSIDSGPSAITNEPTPTLTFSSDQPGSSFECRLDGGSFGACSSPDTLGPLADGGHAFSVRAVNSFGTADPSPAERSFSVDTAPPRTSITKGPKGKVRTEKRKQRAKFRFTSSEAGSTFECRVDRRSRKPCSSPKKVSVRATRSFQRHTFKVWATDAAGNTDPAPAKRSWKVKRRG
jgi:sugar lactone lactonase YvrE